MAKKKRDEPKDTVSARLSQQNVMLLNEVATNEDRSVSYVLDRIVTQHFESTALPTSKRAKK